MTTLACGTRDRPFKLFGVNFLVFSFKGSHVQVVS
jgi:hypothetical protein